MADSRPSNLGGERGGHRGVWHAQPLNETYYPQASALALSAQLRELEHSGLSGDTQSDIRSVVIIQNTSSLDRDKVYESTARCVYQAMDSDPIWINHLITRRRPDLEDISFALNDIFEDVSDYMVLPFEDIVVLIRIITPNILETCAIVTVEPAYTGGEVCYWLRCCIYEGSETASLLLANLRAMVSFYEVLDYPDASIIGDLKYLFSSDSRISAYAEHPRRTQTLFLIPKISSVQRSSKVARGRLAGALIPFGVIGELSPGRIREVTGIELPQEGCAIALPPSGSPSSYPQTVLEVSNSADVKRINWAGMADYLGGMAKPAAPWLYDTYKMCPLKFYAVDYARLIYSRRDSAVRTLRTSRAMSEHIRATTDQHGWDLYSPLLIQKDLGEPSKYEGTPSLDSPPQPHISETAPQPVSAPEGLSLDDSAVEGPDGNPGSGYPTLLSDLPSWVERALPSALELAPRAVREMKKVRHPQPDRIAAALELLAGPRLAIFRGDRTCSRAFHQGLEALRLRDGFSGAERLAGQTGSDYLLHHRGKTRFLERHLASNSSGFNDPKMIRIYYFYDQESDKIVVGWLPTHLQTSKS